MTGLPISLYRAEQVREFDRIAIQDLGIDGFSLMQAAARAAFDVMRHDWPLARTIAVLCGGGNNGGDGYCLARMALDCGMSVRVCCLQDPGALRGDARQAFELFSQHAGAEYGDFNEHALRDVDLVIDALLGTGLDRPVSGEYQRVISVLHASGLAVLALDIPSGLNADTGQAMGTAVTATATVTFIGLKQGLFTGAGRHHCGTLHCAGLDLPDTVYQHQAPAAMRMDIQTLSGLLPPRAAHAHKGNYGHVLVVGGDNGFAGAGRMAAEAAARTGAGLISLATRPAHALAVAQAVPVIMAHGVEGSADLAGLVERATVIAVGPGLGMGDWGCSLLTRILELAQPLVMDADALNLLAREPEYRENWVLSPHPGEAARLLHTSTAEVTADRFAAAQAIQEQFGGVVVLKGSGTLVCDGDHTWVCSAGNPGMASGGMGDVLTGVIAAFIAQGMTLPDAARLGVCAHAAAADRAAEQGQRGLLATDLLPWIRKLVNT